MRRLLSCFLMLFGLVFIGPAFAATLSDLNVSNGASESTVTLGFNAQPVYAFFTLHNPERVVVDIRQSGPVQGLPLAFNGENLIQRIRTSQPVDSQSLRLVLDLTAKAKARAALAQKGSRYTVVVTVSGQRPPAVSSAPISRAPMTQANTASPDQGQITAGTAPQQPVVSAAPEKNPFNNTPAVVQSSARTTRTSRSAPVSGDQIVVAIDAGHGGQDPGAIGPHGTKEKNVTIAIARKLKQLLDTDPMFKPVLTRDGDYFISVMGRSDVARKKNASVLVSVHADAAPNRSASGASVWVLSNRRANSEMANWLEQHEKQSELLGGAGDLLANSSADPYLSQAVLDLQFGHSQRVGYDIAAKVLRQLQSVGSLHKRRPEHASLGVLRSPDIPSLLVETGFISNTTEERLLGSSAYQEKIANAIYTGLRVYFQAHPQQNGPQLENRPQPQGVSSALDAGASGSQAVAQSTASVVQPAGRVTRYTVQRGETLSGIANRHGVSIDQLRTLNNLKRDVVWVGQRLKIPAGGADQKAQSSTRHPARAARRHKVVAGDTLTALSARYGVSGAAIKRANHMKSGNVLLGQTLIIPAA